MSYLNLKQGIIGCCLVLLMSCQSLQKQDADVKPSVIVNADIKPEIKVDESLITLNKAIEHIKNNELELAEDMLKVSLLNHDDSRVKINLALIYMKMNKTQLAKELFISVQNIDANNPVVLEHLAIIARQEGRFQHSKALYLQALNISNKPSIHLNYAILLDLYLNQLKAALLHYEIYQSTGVAQSDDIELDKWIADLNIRIEREN